MAVRGYPVTARNAPRRRPWGSIVGLCIVGLAVLVIGGVIARHDSNECKMGANHIVSPWDTSAAPPSYLGPSRAATNAGTTAPTTKRSTMPSRDYALQAQSR